MRVAALVCHLLWTMCVQTVDVNFMEVITDSTIYFTLPAKPALGRGLSLTLSLVLTQMAAFLDALSTRIWWMTFGVIVLARAQMKQTTLAKTVLWKNLSLVGLSHMPMCLSL